MTEKTGTHLTKRKSSRKASKLARLGPIGQHQRTAINPSDPILIGEPTIDDVAIEWLARLRADDVTDIERADFAQWLWDDPQNKVAFDQLLSLWSNLGRTKDLPMPQTRKAWLPLAQAASIFMVLAFALVLQFGQTSLSAKTGEQLTSVLSDGSQITLNTKTQVEVAYTSANRRVRLISGEVFVDVAANRERPFTVQSQQGTATAVGTGFSVKQMPNVTVVMVEEGRVAVSNHTSHLILASGEMAEISTDKIIVSHPDVSSVHAWRTGRLVYDSVPLTALIDDLNRYLPKHMTISDPKLGEIVVSATLELQDQDSMLEALSEILELDWHIVSDNLIIIQSQT